MLVLILTEAIFPIKFLLPLNITDVILKYAGPLHDFYKSKNIEIKAGDLIYKYRYLFTSDDDYIEIENLCDQKIKFKRDDILRMDN